MHTIFNITPLEAFLNNHYLDGKFGSMALSGGDIASQIVVMYRKGLNSGVPALRPEAIELHHINRGKLVQRDRKRQDRSERHH